MKWDDLELFDRFNTEMWKEYMRHYPKNGDGWKACSKAKLLDLLDNSVKNYSIDDLMMNPSHFIDIANFALFCYYRFSESCTNIEDKKTI
jgi:hypothetical protein